MSHTTETMTHNTAEIRINSAEFRALLARANLSQRALADASGVNVNTIQALYHGRQVPHPETLARLVGAINPILSEMGLIPINPVDLYQTVGFPKGPTPIHR